MKEPETLNPHIVRTLVDLGADVLFVGELRHSLEEIYMETIKSANDEDVGP